MAKILGRMHHAAMIPFVSDELPRDEIYPEQLTLLHRDAGEKNQLPGRANQALPF